ncbi:MAG: hypothetical protein WA888_13945 [Burkholderiaceae bacterium]
MAVSHLFAEADVQGGIDNLLINCLDLQSSERLLIIHEDPSLGWYDAQAPLLVAQAARERGASTTMLAVGAPGNDTDKQVLAAVDSHDCTIFFARLGDQDRFAPPRGGQRTVMCYARSLSMLASEFCQAPYGALKALKAAVDQIIGQAQKLTLTCPRGTRISGAMVPGRHQGGDDVSTLRFPLAVGTPVMADVFSGQVALAHFLTPTGNRVYEPPSIALPTVVMAQVQNGRIVNFEGEGPVVAAVRDHYERVASLFAIDRDAIHSWHAGIHPACAYEASASMNPDLWSNTVFGSPNFAHVHTCGDYPPGEISWMVMSPTIAVDEIALWDSGRLCPHSFEAGRDCLLQWPILNALLSNPTNQTGLHR